jgi:hypothetical protein
MVLPCFICNTRFHLKDCLEMGGTEYELFMNNGISSYKCQNCLQSRNDDTVVTPTAPRISSANSGILINSKDSNDTVNEESELGSPCNVNRVNKCGCDNCCQEHDCKFDTIVNIINNFSEQFGALRAEILVLKQENTKLLDLLQTTLTSKSYAGVVASESTHHNNVQGNAGASRNNNYFNQAEKVKSNSGSNNANVNNLQQKSKEEDSLPRDKLVKNQTHSSTSSVTSETASATRVHNATDVNARSDNDWILVRSKRQRGIDSHNAGSNKQESFENNKQKSTLEKGTRKTNKLKVNAQPTSSKALFVTRFDEDVTCNDITEYINEQLNLIPRKCIKLKTRYPGYASFYILMNATEYEKIANPNFWPEGILYTQFLGKLREEKNSVAENSGSVSPISVVSPKGTGEERSVNSDAVHGARESQIPTDTLHG